MHPKSYSCKIDCLGFFYSCWSKHRTSTCYSSHPEQSVKQVMMFLPSGGASETGDMSVPFWMVSFPSTDHKGTWRARSTPDFQVVKVMRVEPSSIRPMAQTLRQGSTFSNHKDNSQTDPSFSSLSTTDAGACQPPQPASVSVHLQSTPIINGNNKF